MTLSINQPGYIAWLGYFHRIATSDVFVHLDHVQFEKNSMVNRNKIKGSNGAAMLTTPVKTKGKFGDLILADLEIDNCQKWAKKHLTSIQYAYAKSPYFDEIFPFLQKTYEMNWDRINDLIIHMNKFLFDYLGMHTTVLYSSDMSITGTKSELVLNICKDLEASTYLSGPFGRDYLDLESFNEESIEVQFIDYQHPTYQQLHGDFEPYMSILDLIFNHGKDSLNILINKS